MSIGPDSCYKRLLKLCGSPFKSFAIVLAGAAVIGYGVGKLSKWVIDKFADRASKEKQAIVENFAKQISPLTAGAMVGIIYTSPTQISTVSSRLLNRPFKNDREVYYAKNILLDIWGKGRRFFNS